MGSYNCVRAGTAQKLGAVSGLSRALTLLASTSPELRACPRQQSRGKNNGTTAAPHELTHPHPCPSPRHSSYAFLFKVRVRAGRRWWRRRGARGRKERVSRHLSCQATPRSRWTTHAGWCFLRMYVQMHFFISWHEVQGGGAAARADVGGRGAASIWCNCERRGRVAGGQLRCEVLMGS